MRGGGRCGWCRRSSVSCPTRRRACVSHVAFIFRHKMTCETYRGNWLCSDMYHATEVTHAKILVRLDILDVKMLVIQYIQLDTQ